MGIKTDCCEAMGPNLRRLIAMIPREAEMEQLTYVQDEEKEGYKPKIIESQHADLTFIVRPRTLN